MELYCLLHRLRDPNYDVSRLVYEQMKEDTVEGGRTEEETEGEAELEDGQVDRKTGAVLWDGERYQTPEELEKLESIGEAKDYDRFLQLNTEYFMTYVTKELRDRSELGKMEDYIAEWRLNPGAAADFIEEAFPKGPGKKKFIDGLRNPMIEKGDTAEANPAFLKSLDLLGTIMRRINERDTQLHVAREARHKEMEYGGKLSETVKGSISNVLDRFHNAEPGMKVLYVAAAVIGANLLWNMRDTKILGSPLTVGGAAGWGAAVFVANELVSMARDDGKDVLGLLDVKDGTDLLKKSTWFTFALDAETKEEALTAPNDSKIMLEFGDKNVEKVIDIYSQYDVRNSRNFTERQLRDMGFGPDKARTMARAKKTIDGRDVGVAWIVVDKLVKRAGKNFRKMVRLGEAEKRGYKISELDIRALETKEDADYGLYALKLKYTEGPEGYRVWTFEEVVTEEMIDIPVEERMAAIEKHDKERLPSKVAAGAAVAAKTIRDNAIDLAKKTVDVSKKGWNLFKEKGRGWWSACVDKYREVSGVYKDEQKVLEQALKNDPDLKITKITSNAVWLMNKSVTYKEIDDTHYSLNGIVFDGNAANTEAAQQLKEKIKNEMLSLIGASTVKGADKLEKNALIWDGSHWKIPGFTMNGFAPLGIPGGTKDVVVEQGEMLAVFKVDGYAVESFEKLDETLRNSQIAAAVISAYPVLTDIPVTVQGVNENTSTGKVDVTLNIGGLKTTQSVDRVGNIADLPLKLKGLLDAVKLEGSDNLIDRLMEKAAQDERYHRAFNTLVDRVENTEMRMTDRLETLFRDRAFYIFPSRLENVKSALNGNGKLLSERFAHMADFKRAEVIARYGEALEIGTIGDIDKIKKD
ncbi:MAG: hypothetical protein AAB592_03285, partial [Patescibacteria group bacterium]